MSTRVDVKSLRSTAIALLLAGSVLPFLFALVQAQDDVPDLVGKWSGTGWGVVFGKLPHHQTPAPQPRFKQGKMIFSIDIKQQQGRALIGTWSSPNFSERLIGVVRSDNRTVHFVDEDSHFTGIIRSDNEIEVCVQESHEASMVATCYLFRRQ